MNRDLKIQDIAVEYMRSHSMEINQWRATGIGSLWPSPSSEIVPISLEEGEMPLVSASFPNGDWYAWTTRRLLSFCEDQHYEVPAEKIIRGDFGNFKGSLDELTRSSGPIPSLIATLYSKRGVAARITYETGYASMAPIHCLIYWQKKHPILDRLMTPTQLREFLEQRRGSK